MGIAAFTVSMKECVAEIAADALAAVLNLSSDPEQYVAICEVRGEPKAINDDTTNLTGNQGIISLERITAADGGTLLTPVKFDTSASNLPSQVKCRLDPTSVTISGGTIRRFGDCLSSTTILATPSLRGGLRMPGILDTNDHSGRTAESCDVWHADGVSDTEPIVLAAGEGVGIIRREWGVPASIYFGLVVRVVSTGNVYRWYEVNTGPGDELGSCLLSLMNESGSGVTLQVYIVNLPDMGEQNIPRFRLVKTETVFDVFAGTSVSLSLHDTAKSISDVTAYKGPMRLLAWARGEGAPVQYHDYQVSMMQIGIKQTPDTLRVWQGCGPYVRTTSAPNMLSDLLSRAEPELWPGDRRGVGAGLDFPIILRPGQGLAIIGGGGGAGGVGTVETSQQAILDVEFAGYVYTPDTVWPIENDVRNGVNYGPNGADYNGDVVLPAQTDVKTGVGYGADGTEFTGSYGGGGAAGMSRSRVVNP